MSNRKNIVGDSGGRSLSDLGRLTHGRCRSVVGGGGFNLGSLDFITTWRTTAPTESITLPATGTNAFNVDWGDGTVELITTASPSHVYAVAGEYDVSISGSCPEWVQNNLGDKLKVIDVKQWGDVGFINLFGAFYGCANLSVTATDAGRFSGATNMVRMFRGATVANPDVSAWDVSAVTTMNEMFLNAVAANPDVSAWDVSAVTTMNGVFRGATVANPDVSAWDVSAVTILTNMFLNAVAANPDVSAWDVSAATDMGSMFSGSAFSNTNYDLLLAAWSLLTLQLNVPFHAGTAKYTEVAARAVLTGTYLWVITDGGPA